jgi:hypothetical protein
MSSSQLIEIELRAQPARRRELMQTLEEMQALLGDDHTALCCHLYEHATDRDRLLWVEAWPVSEATDEITGSTRFRTLLGAIKVLGRLDELRTVEHRAKLPERVEWLEHQSTDPQTQPNSNGGTQR